MNWNFGFFDADTLKRAAQAVGLGVGASAFSPEEAEGAVRPDIKQVVSNAIAGKSYKGQAAGTLESPVASRLWGIALSIRGVRDILPRMVLLGATKMTTGHLNR